MKEVFPINDILEAITLINSKKIRSNQNKKTTVSSHKIHNLNVKSRSNKIENNLLILTKLIDKNNKIIEIA